VSSDEAFDLSAAALRADGVDLATAIEVLGSRLERALPGIALVERHKVGGFRAKRLVVQRIEVALGEERFELRSTDRSIQCTRHKVVRGITLNRQEMSMADWIDQLIAAVAHTAEVSEHDRLALGELLS